MKAVSNDFAIALANDSTTFTTITHIGLADGTHYYLTEHDVPIPYGGNTYEPYSGYVPSAIKTNINMAVDNQTISGTLGDPLDEADIRGGKYDDALIEVYLIDYANTSFGTMPIMLGNIGEITLEDTEFYMEFRGSSQYLQQKIGELYSVTCQAEFGDSRCKLNKADAAYTKTLTVGALDVTSPRRIFQTNLTDADGYYDQGELTWTSTSGGNLGLKMDVKIYLNSNGQVELHEPMPYDIAVTDTADITVGCDGLFNTCKTKFAASNIVNFRGFPHLTGASKLLQGPP